MATTNLEEFPEPRVPAPPPAPVERVLIEDHALIGDLNTAALVTRTGTIDFLCLPDFDNDACFASLLGTRENGCWRLAPAEPVIATRRYYRPDTLILETEHETKSGVVRVIDFMPIRQGGTPHVVRMIEGVRGEVKMRSEVLPRFANGFTVPIIEPRDGATAAIAGPDGLYLRIGRTKRAEFMTDITVKAGDAIPLVLSWARPYAPIPPPLDAATALGETQVFWEEWVSGLKLPKLYSELVKRSLITLKACTYAPSGAIVAAPTFGLPEALGGERNWDYRFCWVRDSSLTLNALIRAGKVDEARRFFGWLADAIGGAASQLQIMYGIRGERRLTEVELDWLAGYEGAKPVRVGNAAYDQFQLDVFGEFAWALYLGTKLLGEAGPRVQRAMKRLVTTVSKVWAVEDRGIWEVRGPVRAFTASRVSAWAAVDSWVKMIERFKLEEDPKPWVQLRQQIFDDVCTNGFNKEMNSFTQYYGSTSLDASLLAIPLMGFLPPNDPRVVGTVAAIEKSLMPKGLVLRYRTDETSDGLEGEEGTFLPCSFWLADTYHLMGRKEEARALFERLAGLCNDLGLLSEEYLPTEKRQVGNFPQAFSHLALVNAAYVLSDQAEI